MYPNTPNPTFPNFYVSRQKSSLRTSNRLHNTFLARRHKGLRRLKQDFKLRRQSREAVTKALILGENTLISIKYSGIKGMECVTASRGLYKLKDRVTFLNTLLFVCFFFSFFYPAGPKLTFRQLRYLRSLRI